MTKHVLDRSRRVKGAMLPRTIAIDRKRLPKQASLVLQRRSRALRAGYRVKNFIRVVRQTGPMV